MYIIYNMSYITYYITCYIEIAYFIYIHKYIYTHIHLKAISSLLETREASSRTIKFTSDCLATLLSFLYKLQGLPLDGYKTCLGEN
jgi:hypothetical protein